MSLASMFSTVWSAVRQEKKTIALLLLVDFTFFVLFALLHTLIVVQALPDLASISQLVAKESQNVPQVPEGAANIDPSQLQFSFPIGEFRDRFTRVMGYTALYLGVMFVLYNLLYAFLWLKTSTILKTSVKSSALSKRKPMLYLAFLLRFAAVNAIWLLVYLGVFYLFILLASAVMFGQIALASQSVIDIAGIVLAMIILYLAMVSHALLPDYAILPLLKRTAIVGLKRILPIGLAFVLIGVFYYLVSPLLALAAPVSVLWGFILFILLFVPLVTGSRMVFMAAVQGAAGAAKK